MDEFTATPCLRCNYDLRGTADDQPCPECGLLAGRSRRLTDALHESRPAWLRGLYGGAVLLLASMVMLIAAGPLGSMVHDKALEIWPPQSWNIGGGILVPASPPPAFDVEAWAVMIETSGVDLVAILFVAGVFSLTRPEGYEPADRIDRPRRWMIRLSSLSPVVALVLINVTAYRNSTLGLVPFFRAPEVWIAGLLTIGCVPLPALGFQQLRSLARRAGSAHLAEHSSIVSWGASLTLAAIFGVFLLSRMADQKGAWMARSNTPMWLMLIIGTASGLFGLWYFYLLVRFANSFRRAARASKQAWLAADRAAA